MKVVIIGSGNVATVMGSRIAGAGHRILQVVARREEPAARLAAEWNCAYTTQWANVDMSADIYIVSVSDRGLEDLGSLLNLPGRLVVHTAGAVPGGVLSSVTGRWGVLYPLQSLRSGIRPFPDFPLLIAAGRPEDLAIIRDFAITLSAQVREADDPTRLKLHAAAASVNNFTNWLYTQAELFCSQEKLDFSLLYPLIRETSQRLQRYSPRDVQTGPAVRGDQGTIRRHLEVLNNYKDLRELYQLFSSQIERFYLGGENAGEGGR
ncbi:MAG: DUF2520 domain-containing protein [Bacteroidetes bacterium]|nr:DUF2520 domain-containing protein [Bacteroidota bacterium]